jgi:hypothetical protein
MNNIKNDVNEQQMIKKDIREMFYTFQKKIQVQAKYKLIFN